MMATTSGKMPNNICPACKNALRKLRSENNKFSKRNSASHNRYIRGEKSRQKKQKFARTSTPMPDLGNTPATESSSDSVNDFFYQTWKSGLHWDDSNKYPATTSQWNPEMEAVLQPISFPSQVVYVNTVIFQPFMPVPQLGFRSDGTFGFLPMYWPYNGQ